MKLWDQEAAKNAVFYVRIFCPACKIVTKHHRSLTIYDVQGKIEHQGSCLKCDRFNVGRVNKPSIEKRPKRPGRPPREVIA